MSDTTRDLSKVPKQLRPHIESRLRMHTTTVEAVKSVVMAANQPMSAAEVRFKAEALMGRKLDTPNVMRILVQFESDRLISSRIETDAERITRGGGSSQRGYNAKLWFRGSTVPARTKTFEDIVLGDGNATPEYSKKYSKKLSRLKARHAGSSKTPRADGRAGSTKPSVQTGSLDVVAAVKSVIAERDELLARVARLEETLDRLRGLFTK